MRLVVTGTSQALKDIERAQVLLRELGDVIRRLGGMSFADVKSETTVEGAFNEPEACKKARALYEVDNDSALQFLEECTLPREVLRQQGIKFGPTTTGEMYKAYTEWAKTNGFYTNTRTEFKKAICRKYNVKTAGELEIHKRQRYYKFDLVSADLRRELLG